MRNFINIVSTPFIAEGKKENEQMLNPLINGLAVDGSADELRNGWSQLVSRARTVLKKEDRIVWVLRYQLMAFASSNKKMLSPETLTKLLSNFQKKMGFEYETPSTPQERNILGTLEHYLSMPIKDIQNYTFDKQSMEQVIGDFDRFEDEWRESLSGAFHDDEYDDSKVIIDFKNGWFWINTKKAYCSKEAEAMGHCGNSPRSRSADQLLSLRKKIVAGDDVYWEPHLTFILDDGQITEMKGKGNDKPAQRYHDMIIALLLHPIVEGIRGGGYLPENNFSISDLDDTKREELIEKKPELADLPYLYEKYGYNKSVVMKLRELIQDGRVPDYESMNETATVLHEWSSIDDFIRNELRGEMGGMYGIITDAADGDFGDKNISWLEDGDDGWLASFLDYCAESRDDILIRFLRVIENKFLDDARVADGSRIVEMMQSSGIDTGRRMREDVTKRVRRLARAASRRVVKDVPHRGYTFGLDMGADGTIKLEADTDTFIKVVINLTGDGDPDYDDHDLHDIKNSWFMLDDDRMYELEQYLSGKKEDRFGEASDMWNPYTFTSSVHKIAIKQILMALRVAKDPNQYELDL